MTEPTNEPAAHGRTPLRVTHTPVPASVGRLVLTIVFGIVGLAVCMVLLPLSGILRDEDAGEAYYLFPVGTQWTYMEKGGGVAARRTDRVVKVEAGRVWIEAHSETEGSATVPRIHFLQDGFLVETSGAQGAPLTGRRLYQVGSRKGQYWEDRTDGAGTGRVMRHVGLTDVDVKAGRFKNVVDVREYAPASHWDYYFAPGVGLVRMTETVPADAQTKVPAHLSYELELLEFKRGS